MSTVERSTRRPLFRWVALGSTAAFLLSTAYTQAWAGLIDGDTTPGICNQAEGFPIDPDCPAPPTPGDDDDDDDEGLSSGEIAAIAVGGLAVGAGAYYLLHKKKSSDDESEEQSSRANKAQKVTALRFKAKSNRVSAGESRVLELEAKGADGQWRSVTAEEAASIELKGDSAGLMPMSGAKNVFALPITTPASADGKRVTLVGHYAGLTAQTTLQIQVGG